ncbi:MAG: hypothetical protein HKN17_02980 [Rhodothermales bacterium]|nr:hypothetical protein [Rhodothermales bacterium]
MNHTFEDLIEKRLDGTLSEEESVVLERTCREDEHARDALDAAVLTDAMVAVLPDEQPPSGLAASIMDNLPHEAPWPVHAAPGRERSARSRRSARRTWVPVLFGAGGLSLGAVLAVLVMLIWTGPPRSAVSAWDGSQAAGTMSAANDEPPSWNMAGELSAGGAFLVQIWTDESTVRIQAAGESPSGARLVLSYPSGELNLTGVLDGSTPSAGSQRFSAEPGRFESSVRGSFDVEITMKREVDAGSLELLLVDGTRPAVNERIKF